MTPTESTANEPSSKLFTLMALLILAVLPFYWYASNGHMTLFQPREHIPDITPGPSNWFLTLKLPEAPYDPAEQQAYKGKMAAWLATLNREGFHAMRLSDVYERLSRGVGLPDKTVVLSFEPGYGHTYEVVAPLLQWYKTPAVWITNAAAVKRSNRRYVSNYRIWLMKHSSKWDVGFYPKSGMLTIDTQEHGKLFFGSERFPVWATGPVTHALNQGRALHLLNRLKVNSQWSDHELVARLQNEVPVRGTSQLSARLIGDRFWGTSVPGASFSTSLLNLKAPLEKRAMSISWPGTKGLNDFDLQLSASSIVGELWLLMRSDREKGESLRVGFMPAGVVVESERQNQRQRLSGPVQGRRDRSGNFTATLSAKGGQLRISMNGSPVVALTSLPQPSPQAMMEMMVYNKIRGTASADGIRLIFTPEKVFSLPEKTDSPRS